MSTGIFLPPGSLPDSTLRDDKTW